MKEIGGYFGLEQSRGAKEYYPDLVALNTARNALVYICKAKRIKKVYIPYYLCDSVSLVLQRENIDFEYYHTDVNFLPIFDKTLLEGEYFYLVNHYGLLSEGTIVYYKQKYDRIILDNIHAFYQKPINGIDTVYSCRKFFGVPDGAYLSTDKFIDSLCVDNSSERLSHIYGRIKDGANAHYNEFKANDELFKTLPLMSMSTITHKMLANINYELVKSKREENFDYLHKRLRSYNKFNLKSPVGPYAYPLYVENGSYIRKLLQQQKIYVAKLWPNVTCDLEGEMAENVLPIPCDQRYNTEDMELIVQELQKHI